MSRYSLGLRLLCVREIGKPVLPMVGHPEVMDPAISGD
jgi:hypothetical protein